MSVVLVAVGAGATATRAEEMAWHGTLDVNFANPLLPSLSVTGVGVAAVEGGVHLSALRLAGGIRGSAQQAFSHSSAPSLVGVSASVSLGSGSLAPFSPAGVPLTRAALPVRGALRLCLFFSGCNTAITLDLSQGSSTAVGVGGLLTVGGAGPLRISVAAAPWTVRTASLDVLTVSGQPAALTSAGWVHGPFSFTSSTALANGFVSLVTPISVQSALGQEFSSFARLSLRFVPEPRAPLALAAGCAAIALLARRRGRDS